MKRKETSAVGWEIRTKINTYHYC